MTEDTEQPAAPAEETAWWRTDAAQRASLGEDPGAGEEGTGLDEPAFRRRFPDLFHDSDREGTHGLSTHQHESPRRAGTPPT